MVIALRIHIEKKSRFFFIQKVARLLLKVSDQSVSHRCECDKAGIFKIENFCSRSLFCNWSNDVENLKLKNRGRKKVVQRL